MFKRNLKLVTSSIIALLALVLSVFVKADITPSDSIDMHYDFACTNLWKGLKYTIPKSGHTTKPPWASATDKNQFVDYLRTYLIDVTLPTTDSDKLSNDALTVASECIKRRNAIVDRNFNRNIGGDIDYALRFQALIPILAQYSQLSRRAIELDGIRKAEEAAELERRRLGRIMTVINQQYFLILQAQKVN